MFHSIHLPCAWHNESYTIFKKESQVVPLKAEARFLKVWASPPQLRLGGRLELPEHCEDSLGLSVATQYTEPRETLERKH